MSFLESDYSCMLVSQQYLDEAARIFSQENVFSFEGGYAAFNCLRSTDGKENVSRELFKHISMVELDTVDTADAQGL